MPDPRRDVGGGEDQRTNYQLRQFKGVNVTDARQGIDDDELAWEENALTIGKGLIRVVPGPAAPIANYPAGLASIWGFTLNGDPVILGVGQDGKLVQITVPAGAVTTGGASSTLQTAAMLTIWQDSNALIIDPSTGLYDWDGTTLTHHTGGAIPSQGTAIAVFEGRSWIANGRTIHFSAPDDGIAGSDQFANFDGASGAGSFIMTDSAFPGDVTALISALQQLWIFSAGAVNAVSNVTVTLVGTVFSNINIVTNIGTVQPKSTIGYFRSLAFMAQFGIYALVGVSPQKLSDKLDGLFPNLDLDANSVSAGVAQISELLVLCFLVQYEDPVAGETRPLLLCFNQGKWFFAAQGELTDITTVLVDGVPQLWGTDGSNVFQCFAGSSAVEYLIQTKLWDFGDSTRLKQVTRFGIELKSANPIMPTVELDNGQTQVQVPLSLTNTITWLNNLGVTITWQNALLETITWVSASTLIFARSQASQFGDYIGVNVYGTDLPWDLNGVVLEYTPRGIWDSGRQ